MTLRCLFPIIVSTSQSPNTFAYTLNSRTFFNTHPVCQLTSCFIAVVSLMAHLLVSLMKIQFSFSSLTHQNVLINPLMADVEGMSTLQSPRYLLWTPVQSDLFVDQVPGQTLNTLSRDVSAVKSIFVRLFRSISSQTVIAFQFSAGCLFIPQNHLRNLCLFITHFQQSINLVSLFTGKLFVSHKRSFDLAVLRGLSYYSLPLSTFKVALIS